MEIRNHILIVEESFDISLITSKIFQYQNWQVTKASTGEEALSFLNSNNVDIILMDINLPGMSGIECCDKIRHMPDKVKSVTPIIAVTANALEFDLNEYKKRGFTYFFQKPVFFDKLIDKIKSILHRK